MYVIPELNRRERVGGVPPNFELHAVQILFETSANPEVRLNEQVQFVIKVRDPSVLQTGQTARGTRELGFDQLMDEIEDVSLASDDRPNAAHVTMVRHSRGWSLYVDLRYNAARMAEALSASREFLDAARASANRKQTRAFVTEIFTAVELLARAQLIIGPDPRLLNPRRHNLTRAAFNRYAKQGRVESRFSKLLNRLTDLRNPARYSLEPFSLAKSEVDTLLADAEELFRQIEALTPARVSEQWQLPKA
jgi:uncharacterized protein (UPF0332 family)